MLTDFTDMGDSRKEKKGGREGEKPVTQTASDKPRPSSQIP